ncbi:hypothetical protein HanRHA438_Chr12g0545851 [Helianthus annuus]|nr:hypothetical protein HanRHA438_Chr12g0545851 [Helianthus annuus]
MEGLTQKPLDFTGTSDSQLVVFTKLIHSKNSNNILKILVVLKNFLYTTSCIVMVFSQNVRGKHTRRGIKWVHSRVDTKF